MTTNVEKPEHQKNNGTPLFALIISVFALALSAFTYFVSTQNQTASQLQSLETSITALSQESDGRSMALQKQIAVLNKSLPLSSQKTLAEIDFLITVANTQLAINDDVTAALRALKTAEALIIASNDKHFIGLLTAIQSDAATLQKMPMVNRSQAFADISTVIQKIQSLSTLPQTPTISVSTAVPVADVTKPWYQQLLGVLSQLKGLVIIRHVNENNPPLVAPMLELNLKQNIIAQLTMAQWALLHHNAAVYQSALQNVNEWTTRYFALTTERDGVATTLAQLMSMNVAPVLPTLTNTLSALKQVNLLPADSVKESESSRLVAAGPVVSDHLPAKPEETTKPADKMPMASPEKPSNTNPTTVET